MKIIFLHTIMLFCITVAVSQTRPDSLLPLSKQEIAAKTLSEITIFHPKFNIGTKTDSISNRDKLNFSGRFLADVLSAYSNAYLKQTAPGQLATITLNGGTAAQTQLVWNGISLNNGATGLTDFSLIPVSLFDDIAVFTGSTGVTGGSGSVSGSILLGNHTLAQNTIKVKGGFHYGNFGRFSFNAGFEEKKLKSGFSLQLFHTNYKNNYTYFNSTGEKEILQNAWVNALGGIGSYSRKTRHGEFSSMLWVQENKRAIPGTIYQTDIHNTQNDFLLRFLNTYKLGSYGNTYFNLGYLNDQIEYNNGFDKSVSKATVHTLFSEAKTSYIIRNVKNLVKASGHLFWANNTGYAQMALLPRFSLTYGLQENVDFFTNVIYNWSLSIREEVNDFKFSLPMIQGGVELSLKPKSKKTGIYSAGIKLNGGSVYRFPTLNDLYWVPGGNPDLLPEQGISAGGSVFGSLQKPKQYELRLEFTHFERYMFDMIVWMPNGSVWSPFNITQVWSRGNETRLYAAFFDKCKLSIDSRINYTLSTPQKTAIENDASIGKQMLYVPMYTARLEPAITFKQVKLSYTYNYTGYRYTSTDNYEYLEPFHLHTARLSYLFTKKTFTSHIYVELDNITNTAYQWVAIRPAMPRNFIAGIQFNFTKHLKKNNNDYYEELL